MRSLIILFFAITFSTCTYSQFKNNIWCFGDSVGLDFKSGFPQIFSTSIQTRGTAVSIADSNYNLLFYGCTRANTSGFTTGKIWNNQHQLMQNGGAIFGNGWYHEMLALPYPSQDSLFIIISTCVTSIYGLKYSIINMNLDSTKGGVSLKNQTLVNFPIFDCLAAVKHGNGRDWWILFKTWDTGFQQNQPWFYKFLVTPSGFSTLDSQLIGSPHFSNSGEIFFNTQGDKFGFLSWSGLIEQFDFDRCTGVISNPVTIEPEAPYKLMVDGEYSPSGEVVYASYIEADTNYLFQYDMNAPNIAASRDTIYTFYSPVQIGHLKRAPDDKIYLSCAYATPFVSFPYPDSVYNYINMNLSVINQPDSLGSSCNFQPFSFYLNGKRTYYGLPNNPDYELDAITGSVCDTLTGISNIELGILSTELNAIYINKWQKLFVNAQNIKGRNCILKIFDMSGREVFASSKKTQPPYFTQDVDVSSLASGLYLVSLITEKEMLSSKFVKD